MPRTTPRIEIPKNPEECIKLAGKVVAKHIADGVGSPLTGIGMADMAGKQAIADQQNTLSVSLYSQAGKATENRDNALGTDTSTQATVRFYLSAVRDILLGKYRGNESALGDWGFNVVTSGPAAKAAKKPATKPA
jgi:hypothetical protein